MKVTNNTPRKTFLVTLAVFGYDDETPGDIEQNVRLWLDSMDCQMAVVEVTEKETEQA